MGSGRVTLGLLRDLGRSIVRGLEIVLVTADREHYVASASSALLRGVYSLDEMRVDVGAIAERAGARVVWQQASSLDVHSRTLQAGDERITFDVCVLDEVGPPSGAGLPGVTTYTIPLRPVSLLPEVRRELDARLAAHAGAVRCTVVGAGRRGVECAFALQRMLAARADGGVVTIVDAMPHILDRLAACRDLAHRALERMGVCFALGTRAVEVRADAVVLASGAELPSDLVIWATEGAPSSIVAAGGLPHDADGRLLVDRDLRSDDGAPVWGAGDCVAVAGAAASPEHQLAAIEGSVRAALGAPRRGAGGARSAAPCLLDTGDGRAMLRWGTLTAWSHLAWAMKRRRDRRLVARLAEP
ncbi:MAG TPA: FAD-dependent oxidoreductase [Gemmatimonadaceae bacterium]|nr:FAD-dependent oxidoreductase [Gemmatimonadaceae bacterium]